MRTSEKNGITEGVIWKQLLIFFFPIGIGTFFQQLYNTEDSEIVGRFVGKEALSSVGGSAGQIINLVVGFFTGLSTGATVILSQFYGAAKKREVDESLHTSYAFAILGGILLGVLGILSAPAMLRRMNTPEELMAESTIYVRVYFAGLIFIFIYNIGAAILRAIGDSKRPLYYLIICSVVNIVLDLLFIVTMHLGVLGAALATLIAQAVSAGLVTFALMYRTQGMKLELPKIKIYQRMLGSILRIGFPAGLEAIMYSVSNIIVQVAINNFGVDTMAAWTAYSKIDFIFWMINNAFGISIMTFVGLNFGAGKWDRIKKGTQVCLGMGLVSAVALSVILMTGGHFLFGMFVDDADVVRIGMRMMNTIAPTYFLFIFIEVFSGALRAQGAVVVSTIITMVGICFLRMAWVTMIAPHGTLEQMIFCYPISWGAGAVAMSFYYIFKQRRIFNKFSRSSLAL